MYNIFRRAEGVSVHMLMFEKCKYNICDDNLRYMYFNHIYFHFLINPETFDKLHMRGTNDNCAKEIDTILQRFSYYIKNTDD